jgi:quercetin dioxygenase-like cupin family protein
MDIAKALNVGLRYFFETEAEAAYVVRADQGQADLAPDSSAACLHLTPEVGSAKIEAYRVILQPCASSGQLAPFAGEEFVFVLAGKLTLSVGDEQFVLDAGDSIHYDALQLHCWHNEGSEACVVIWGRAASLG